MVFHANQNHKAAAVISLGQDKAFDMVEGGGGGFIPCIADYEFWVFLLYFRNGYFYYIQICFPVS